MSQTSVKNQWYCGVEGQQYGPYSWEQMRAMAEEGRVVAETYVRREGDQQWFAASQVPGLLKSPQPAGSETKVRVAQPTAAASAPAVIPVGAAVAPAAVPAPPVSAAPASFPVGFAVQTTARSKAAPPKTKWRTEEEAECEPKPKQTNALLIVGILAGVVLLVGVSGIGLLVWTGMRAAARVKAELQAAADKIEADLAAATPPAGEANPLAGEANPLTPALPAPDRESNPIAAAPAATKSSTAGPPAARAHNPAAAKLVSTIAGWTDVARSGGVRLLEVRLQVRSAWLAADESGTRVPIEESKAAAAKFVFVELELTNTAKGPRTYTSWNSTAGTSAILADAGGQPLAFVPASDTPAVNRLGAVEIPPSRSVTDTLVFHAPAGSEHSEKFKLALAKSALAGRAKTRGSHFAFEIPHEILLRGAAAARPASDISGALGGGPMAANRGPLAEGGVPAALSNAVAPPSPTSPAPATPMPATPASATEPRFDPKALDREIQELAKKEGEMAGKEMAGKDMPSKTAKGGKAAKGDGK